MQFSPNSRHPTKHKQSFRASIEVFTDNDECRLRAVNRDERDKVRLTFQTIMDQKLVFQEVFNIKYQLQGIYTRGDGNTPNKIHATNGVYSFTLNGSEDLRFQEALTVAYVTLNSKLDVPKTNAYVVPNSLDDNQSKSRKLAEHDRIVQ